jgi:hypothetical protein
MNWTWMLLSIAVTVCGLLYCYLTRPDVDEEHCPYKVGTGCTDCTGTPCEVHPPCRHP